MNLKKRKRKNKENLKICLDENDLKNISGGYVVRTSASLDENGNGKVTITVGGKTQANS